MQHWLGVMVVPSLASSPGCQSRQEPARSQGFPIPADNVLNEIARVRDSVRKSPSCGLEWQMTSTVVSSVCPVALLVHLVHRHAFPRPVSGRCIGLLKQRHFGSLAARALCLARRRRRFVPLSSGGASARSAAAAILLARRLQSRLARRRRHFDSLSSVHCLCYCRQLLLIC